MDAILRALEAWWELGGVAVGETFGAKGMFHKLLSLFLGPVMMTLPFLIMLTLYLVKSVIQSSSHNFPMEIKEPVFNPSISCPCRAVEDSSGASGTWTSCVAFMTFPSAAMT